MRELSLSRATTLSVAMIVGWTALACGGLDTDDGAAPSPSPVAEPAPVQLTAEDLAGEVFTKGFKAKAIRSKTTKPQSATFIQQYGKIAQFKFADYNTGWVLVKQVDPQGAIQPIPAEDRCEANVGDRVLAHWSTSYSMWPGTVQETYGKMAFLHFDDGERDWAECAKFEPIPEPSTGGGGGGGVSDAVSKCQRGCNSQCNGAQNKSKCVGECRRACAK